MTETMCFGFEADCLGNIRLYEVLENLAVVLGCRLQITDVDFAQHP